MTKNILIFTCLLILISTFVQAENSTLNKTKILEKELISLNIQQPAKDLNKKLAVGDFRFIGLYGYTTYFPGINKQDYNLVEKYGSIFFEGTTDSIESEKHGNLIKTAKEYAQTYNLALLNHLDKHNVKRENGYVPNEETAIQIALAVWTPIYGKEIIEGEKPYHAVLKDEIWYVEGSLHGEGRVFGGVAEAEIFKENGCIIRINHGR